MNSFTSTKDKFISRELLIELNKAGIITNVSSNCFHILGYTDKEMLNTNISNYIKYSFDDIASTRNFNTEIITKDGLKLYFDVHATPIVNDNNVESLYLSIINITKYKELEAREKMFYKMCENSKDLICRYELVPEPRFTYLNNSIESLLGYTVEECCKNPMLPFEITHPDDIHKQLAKINSKTDFSQLFEIRFKHKDGHYIWLQDYIIPTFDDNGQLIAVESITRDVTHIKEFEYRLERLGYTDNLTDLYNQNYFLKEINLLNSTVNVPVGIIVCDLDRLKYVNDSWGHLIGDALIKNTAKVLKSVFDNEQVVARVGGDEFVIIIKDKSYTEVEDLYNKLQNSITLFNERDINIPIDISIGFAYSETSVSKMQIVLDDADNHMYKNKRYKRQEA